LETYDWMVKYTPQVEWVRRRGVLLWLAFFFIELGAGAFFVSSILTNLPGLVAGWCVCAFLGGGLHLLYLGRPGRFWRMLASSGWRTSWISRGLIFVSLFLLVGLISLLLTALDGRSVPLVVIADIFAFLTVVYGGFAMNYINGIPLWNSALLPVLFLISGLWGGSELAFGISLGRADAALGSSLEVWIRILLLGFLVLVPVYLISVRYISPAGQASVKKITVGEWSKLFWGGVVFLGMLIPLAAVIGSLVSGTGGLPSGFYYAAIACGLAGDLVLRNLILRCGLYSPLIPSPARQTAPI
jgi:sulfite dehydrogenase (quinone) subunit SoeC